MRFRKIEKDGYDWFVIRLWKWRWFVITFYTTTNYPMDWREQIARAHGRQWP